MKPHFVRRIADVRARLQSNSSGTSCDCALITNIFNIRYLTGFTGSSAFFFITPRDEHLVVDFRYIEQAAQECGCRITRREGPLESEIVAYLGDGRQCAVESNNMTLAMQARLSQAGMSGPIAGMSGPIAGMSDPIAGMPGPLAEKAVKNGAGAGTQGAGPSRFPVQWIPVDNLVEAVRIRKDDDEIRRLTESAALLEDLMAKTLTLIKPGIRELDIAIQFEMAARKATGRPLPFEPIIASGFRAALPHGIASTKEIARGEFVVVDIGLNLDGYVADMTRTVAVGEADAKMKAVHDAVHLANRTAAMGIRPGMTGQEAHMLALAVLEAEGFGTFFGHGLGHGIGIQIHEDPRLAPHVTDTLETNMVFTVEPGVYIPHWGGVRIEDSGVLRESGVEIFNKMDRGLMIV